jgi:hypothetical protein
MMEGVHFFRRCLVVILAVGAWAQPPEVQKMWRLFGELAQASAAQRKLQFQLTEQEVNDYLRGALTLNPRPGLEKLTAKFFPGNYVSTFTVIDFDMVEKARPGTVPAILRPVLNGKKEVWIDVRLRAVDGFATFSVEKAYFQSIRLPAFAVEKMINVLGARQREKFDTSKPLPLPFGLRRLVTGDKTVIGEN